MNFCNFRLFRFALCIGAVGLFPLLTAQAQTPQPAAPESAHASPSTAKSAAPAKPQSAKSSASPTKLGEPDPHAAEEQEAEQQALDFLQSLDEGLYSDSYGYTSQLIRSKLDGARFAQEAQSARAPMGTLESRTLMDASYTAKLPGAPAGQYVVVQYKSQFAKKTVVETLTLSHEDGYWLVAGWGMK